MKALLIEDELAAAQGLQTLLGEVAPDLEVVGVLQSVEESVEWFEVHPQPDLVFMDIHLADGSSFSIFEQINITCPIIFTTAYDQYALRAFEVNSIDYLLKPVDRGHLERAIAKFRNRSGSEEATGNNRQLIEGLLAEMRLSTVYKSALLIPVKDKLIPVQVKDIAYIYIEQKMVHLVDYHGKRTFIDQTLDELNSRLDPRHFFRANRQYIIARDAIKDVSFWFNGRLSVNLSVKTPERILISRTHVKEFKNWLTL